MLEQDFFFIICIEKIIYLITNFKMKLNNWFWTTKQLVISRIIALVII